MEKSKIQEKMKESTLSMVKEKRKIQEKKEKESTLSMVKEKVKLFFLGPFSWSRAFFLDGKHVFYS